MKKKLFLTLVPLALLLMQLSPATTQGVGDTGSENATDMISKKGEEQTGSEVLNLEKLDVNEEILNFTDNPTAALEWSNRNFPSVFSEETDHIQSINKQLRQKYMNRSELYEPFKELEFIDGSFFTELSEDIIVYANLTPDDFGIDSKYFVDNTDKVYDSMLKDSLFGIDHGFFLGSMDKPDLDHSKNEYIQVSLIVPKGTKVTRVGSMLESKYIIPRESTFSYVGKNFNRDSKSVHITAELISRDVLDEATKKEEVIIENKLESEYGVPPQFITLVPLGLNAGYVLTDSLTIISKSFESLDSGGIPSKDLFYKEKVIFTNGWMVHTATFDRLSIGDTLEERQKRFEKHFSTATFGETQIWDDDSCESIVTFSHTASKDYIPEIANSTELAATLLHEFFHYFIASTNFFEDRPLFQGDSDLFKDIMRMLKDQDEGALVDLLKNGYAKKNWEEFICEAFMAKFHPEEEIKIRFKQEIPATNRMLDNLFDYDPPTSPTNVKDVEVGGNSVKLTFDHSSDNIGVDMYNVYQDGKLIESVVTEKDKDDLSYPNPGDYQSNIEVTIDNLNQVTDYEFQVTAIDDARNESAKSETLKIRTKDTEPPELTGPLRGQALVSTGGRLNWSHPTDNQGVKEVRIYRNESPSKLLTNKMEFFPKVESIFTVSGEVNYYTDFTVEKGKSYTYYMIALDEAGNESKKSNDVVIKTEDKDDDKKNEDKAENVTSSNATLNWSGAFEGVGASGFQIFSWTKGIAGWLFGGVTSAAGTATSSTVSLIPGMAHQFVVIPVDSKGNAMNEGLQISVDSIDRSSIQTKDSELYAGQSWNKADNFVSATDEDGKVVSFDDERILKNEASVDTTKPGVYEFKYSFQGVVKTTDSLFKVTVKEDKSSIQTKDVTIYVGQNWKREDNFVSATDEEGKAVPWSDGRIDSNGATVDTTKPGEYNFRYTFKGMLGNVDSLCKVTVIEDQSSIQTKDSELYAGQAWDKANNFVSAIDEDGKVVPFDDERILTNEASIDTTKPGVYELIYSFKGILKTTDSPFKVTVKEDKTAVELQDVSLYVGQIYNPDSPFKNVTDKDGKALKAVDVDWYYIDEVKTKELDTSKPGSHDVRIVYLDGAGQWKYSETHKLVIKEDKSSIQTKDSELYAGQSWNKEDNFVSAMDEEGKTVSFEDGRITTNGASVDTTKPGVHELKYSFNGVAKTTDSMFKVTVKEDKSSIQTKDVTIYVGQNWKREDNFVSATDEDGKAVPWSDGRIDSNGAMVDTSKPGEYNFRYTFKGKFGDVDSACKVTVKATISLFDEDFSSGLSGWNITDNASIQYYNGKPYVFIDGSSANAQLQKVLQGLRIGASFRFTVTGSGNVMVMNSIGPQISFNTGSVNMSATETRSYEAVAVTDSIWINIVSYNATAGISNVKVELLD